MAFDEIKRKVGFAAAELVNDGMTVGLGTGSTAFFFIERLIEKTKQGLKIRAVASSRRSEEQARQGGIVIADINSLSSLDITVDGADEIDSAKRLIKGGGGALVREKIVAAMSQEMVVVVDESKLSSKLGNKKLPVEVIPFGIEATRCKIEKLGLGGVWRKNPDTTFYVTDNGNYIFDIFFKTPLDNPEEVHAHLIAIPGVVDTGFFFGLAGRTVIGFSDGQVVIE